MRMMGLGRRVLAAGAIAAACALGSGALRAQGVAKKTTGTAATEKAPASAAAPVDVLIMSDIHFDPFRDPNKAQRLMDAPEGEWNKILEEVDATDQRETYARLQKTCRETADDSPYTLLQSSLAAMKDKAPDAKFALLTGDLVVHSLECRFRTLLPDRPASDYKTLVTKTEQYVIDQIRLSLAGVPLYVAMGNNDSACKDYALEVDDPFLGALKETVVGWLPAGAQRTEALASFSHMGDYSMTMVAPMKRTRLLVLDDLYQSSKYIDCNGKPDRTAADAQIAWLEKELAGAKRRGERVWVMGHIPPGIDSYGTISKGKDVCHGDAPVVFLSSERLADVMAKYADVIRLGIFAHTHMDEIRLFGDEKDSEGSKGKVAIKMVPSITPLAAGVPEFTVAKVNPETAQMVDYTVYSASNATGVNAVWKKMYTFGETYQVDGFTPETLNGLIEGFEADPEVQGSASGAYLRNVIAGQKGLLLRSLWPEYACVLEHHTVKGFAACMCPAK